jgi:hypothetical protein
MVTPEESTFFFSRCKQRRIQPKKRNFWVAVNKSACFPECFFNGGCFLNGTHG